MINTERKAGERKVGLENSSRKMGKMIKSCLKDKNRWKERGKTGGTKPNCEKLVHGQKKKDQERGRGEKMVNSC